MQHPSWLLSKPFSQASLQFLIRPWRPVAVALALAAAAAAAAAVSGCSSLTPVERLVIAQDAGPLLAQIRGGEVGIDDLLPWGGAFGVEPSYFTPLCAAVFGGAVDALEELLVLGADVDVRCRPSVTPLELVMRRPSDGKASLMRSLLHARGAGSKPVPDERQARL
jgi:hypothetical protein